MRSLFRGKLRKILILSALLLASIPQTIHSQSTELFRSWNRPFTPFRIIGNIYYVGASEIASYLITTSEGHILLDGGFEETAPIIAANIEKLGFRLDDVEILLNSHAHFDHAGGLAQLKELTGAKLMIMDGDAETILNGGRSLGPDFTFPPVKIDRILQNEEIVSLGKTRLKAHLTPGHTKGNTTWAVQIEKNDQKVHVVFAGSPNVLPDVPLVDNHRYPEIAEDYKKTFAVLKKLPCDVFLGAHSSFFLMQKKAKMLEEGQSPNPFIDPHLYKRFVLRKEKIFLERLADEQEQAK